MNTPRNLEVGALNAVADAVNAEQPQRETVQRESVIEDFTKLSTEPLLKFFEAAAKHCEQIGAEVASEGNKLDADCKRLATEIRQCAEAQAEAIRRHITRTRAAVTAIAEIRNEFRADLAREVEEVKATREIAERKVG